MTFSSDELRSHNLRLALRDRAEQAHAHRLARTQLGAAHPHVHTLKLQLDLADALVRSLDPAVNDSCEAA